MPHSISYQGYKIQTYQEGKGEALVFLHGWPTNAKLWQAQVERFKENFKIITLDWLGFGQSDKPLDFNYSFRKKKEILDEVLSYHLNSEEKINIVAHDIGGPAAILWATENQDRISRLILLNTVIYPFKTKLDAFSEVLFTTPLIKDILASQFGLSRIMASNTRSGQKETKTKIKEILSAYEQVDKRLKLKTILDPLHHGKKDEFSLLSQIYSQLVIDKYLIIAKKDPLCYAHIKKLSEENPEVPRFYIDNCGHYIPIDQPQALNKILSEILIETAQP